MNQTDVLDALLSGTVKITDADLLTYKLKHGSLEFNTRTELLAALPALIDLGVLRISSVTPKSSSNTLENNQLLFFFEKLTDEYVGVKDEENDSLKYVMHIVNKTYIGQELMKRFNNV